LTATLLEKLKNAQSTTQKFPPRKQGTTTSSISKQSIGFQGQYSIDKDYASVEINPG